MRKSEEKTLAAYLGKVIAGAEKIRKERESYASWAGWAESGMNALIDAAKNGTTRQFLEIHSKP